MENHIIIGIIAAILAVGVYYTVKHFKGEGGCCGGDHHRKDRKSRI